jgi:signal peptidase I
VNLIKKKIPRIKFLLTPRIRKIFSWSVFGFLLLVLIFFLFPLLPIENNYSLKMVLSGSMEPTIKTGGIVMVKPASEYQIGDVITYQYGHYSRNLTTHRIIGKTEEGFITQGDNNNAADLHPVEREQIKGKVLLTIPYVGYAANFARSKFGAILFIFIPALLIIVSESIKIFKEVKKMPWAKNKIKDIKSKISIFLIFYFALSSLVFIGATHCYFSDVIILENNIFQAGEWVPTLNPIGDQETQVESPLEFTVSATDPNNDSLTYLVSDLPAGANFSEKMFSWTPNAEQTGTYSGILFKVSDGKYTDSESITITVTATSTSD